MKTRKRAIAMLLTMLMMFSMFPIYSSANNVIETAIAWATGIANDNTHGYSQANRYGPDYDCSSLVTTAFRNAGINVPYDCNTRNMKERFVNAGFVWIPASSIPNFPSSSANLKRGDILLKSGHTELYIGNNQNIGAHDNYNGIPGGIGGGKKWSDGYKAYRYGADEIDVCKYWNGSWTGVLRYNGGETIPGNSSNPNDYPYPTRDLFFTSPVQTGDDVKWVQSVLSKIGYSVAIDGSYGPSTRDAIKAFQRDHGLSVDGSCGPATRAKLLEEWNRVSGVVVVNKPTWATIKANRTEMTVGETISFEFNSDNANSYTIGIDCNNNRVLTETVGNNKSFSYTCTQAGKYSAYISASNSAGGLDSSRVYWTVKEKEITVYTITYNANGGSGGPSSQQKNKGQSLTISSEFPERFGYSFVGWSTSSTSDKAQYIPGSTFSKDADTTLYAVWSSMIELSSKLGKKTGALEFPYAGKCKYYKITPAKDGSYRFEITDSSDVQLTIMNSSGGAIGRFDNYGTSNTFYIDMDFKAGETYYIKIEGKKAGTINYDFRKIYTLTYDTQGGTDGPLKQIKLFDVDINTSSKIPSREGYTFLGWSLSPDSTEVKIKSGSIMKYTGNHDDILYAVWEKNAHTHNWEWKTEEPTCTQNGKKYQICECGETQNVTYLPYSHNFGEWVVVDRETEYPFTITQQRTCSVCGETETSLIVSTPSSPDEILYGDANLDGEIDIFDVLAIVEYLNGIPNTEFGLVEADACKDGSVDIFDVLSIVEYLNGFDIDLG